jgi:hypothetical protein
MRVRLVARKAILEPLDGVTFVVLRVQMSYTTARFPGRWGQLERSTRCCQPFATRAGSYIVSARCAAPANRWVHLDSFLQAERLV